MSTLVCAHDGVEVVESRTGKLIHLDELPRGTGDHDIDAVDLHEYLSEKDKIADWKAAAAQLMSHHASIHPVSDCPFVVALATAIRGR